MANSDAPQGLVPVRHRNGAPYSGSGSLYYVAAAHAGIINPGDPVTVTGTASALGVPAVDISTAGDTNPITGIMISRINGDGTVLQDDTVPLPATTEGWILVEDNPDVVFRAQVSVSIAATDISNNADMVAGAAVNGRSGWEVDSATFGAGATKQVKVIRLERVQDNELGTNAKIEVMINNHTQAHNTAGV